MSSPVEQFAVPKPKHILGTNAKITVNGVLIGEIKSFEYSLTNIGDCYVLKDPVPWIHGTAIFTGQVTGWRVIYPFRVKRGRGQRRNRRNRT